MKYLIGVDEAGRGAWAGPFVASAVCLDDCIDELDDSKKLTPKKRIELENKILNGNNVTSVVFISPEEIDKNGLTWAQQQAMGRAVEEVIEKLGYQAGSVDIILDGKINYLLHRPNTRAVIAADSKHQCVSAASVLAKQARDRCMHKAALKHPGYGFKNNVGYGTKEHSKALAKLGVTKLHRKSYKPVKAFCS